MASKWKIPLFSRVVSAPSGRIEADAEGFFEAKTQEDELFFIESNGEVPPQPDLPTLIATYPAASNAGKTAMVGDFPYYADGTDWRHYGYAALQYLGGSGSLFPAVRPENYGDVSTDATAAIQAALNASNSIILTAGTTYTVTDTIVLPAGRVYIYFNGATVNASFGTNYSKALFSNNKTTDASTTLFAEKVSVTGNCTAFDMRFTANNPGAGLGIVIDGLYMNTMDGNRRAGTKILDIDQADFCAIRNVVAWNLDVPFMLGRGGPRRTCTQILLDLVMVAQVNSAFRIQGLSKARINGFDVMGCNSGFSFEGENELIEMVNCHVEGIGKAGYSASSLVSSQSAGTGFNFVDSQQHRKIRLVRCDVIDLGGTGGTATAGIRIGRNDFSQPILQTITLEDCNVASAQDASASYKPLVNRGRFKWKGLWGFTNNANLSANGLGYIDMEIDDTYNNAAPYIDLIGGGTVLSLVNGSATNAPTITEVSVGTTSYNVAHQVVFNAAGYEMIRTINAPYGWITIDVVGYTTSGNPILFVQQNGGSFTDLVRIQFVGSNDKQRRWRVCFWNDTANQGLKIGLSCQAVGNTCVVQSFNVYSGLPRRDVPQTMDHLVTALPTASARWRFHRMALRNGATDETRHTCVVDAAGTYLWKQYTLT
jgi:hypothetical protein